MKPYPLTMVCDATGSPVGCIYLLDDELIDEDLQRFKSAFKSSKERGKNVRNESSQNRRSKHKDIGD